MVRVSRFPILAFLLSVPAFAGAVNYAFLPTECFVYQSLTEASCSVDSFSPGATSPWNGISVSTPDPIQAGQPVADIISPVNQIPYSVGLYGSFRVFAPKELPVIAGIFNDETFPVAWDFIANADGEGIFNWNLEITAGDQDENSFSLLSRSGTGIFGQSVIGSGVTNAIAGDWTYFFIDISVSSTSGPFSLYIPGGQTIDFNPVVADAEAPEPGTIFLGGAALLAMAGLKTRNRRKN